MQNAIDQEGDSQDNYVETRDPAELVMCVILAAAYAGLSRYCWAPLQTAGNWRLFVNVEGFFITITILALLVGLRPYLSPCSLQFSKWGVKYRGPYWPQRKTVNWDRVFKLYLSPDLAVVLYYPNNQKKWLWPLIIQSIYLADKDKIPESFARYCTVPPVLLAGPSWYSRLILITAFVVVVLWILELLAG